MRRSGGVVLVCLLCMPLVAWSAGEDTLPASGPSLTGVWRRGGETVTAELHGSGFGSHELRIASAVGDGSWIEAARPGSSVVDASSGEWRSFATKVPAVIDASRPRAGRRSINASVDRARDDDWNKILYFTADEGFRTVYATWWVWFRPLRFADGTQWKMWRITDEAGDRLASDNCASLVQSSRWAADGTPTNSHTVVWCRLGCAWPAGRSCYEHVEPRWPYTPIDGDPYNYKYHSRGGTAPLARGLPTPGEWCRIELRARASDVDRSNGGYWLAVTDGSGARYVVEDWVDGLMTHTSDCCNDESGVWKHFVLHGYFDDDGGPFADELAEIFYDDVYLQFGTEARVELGNQPDYTTCSQLEIQLPLTWSDARIEVELNPGTLEPGSRAWMFVIDAEGRASQGMAITLPDAD